MFVFHWKFSFWVYVDFRSHYFSKILYWLFHFLYYNAHKKHIYFQKKKEEYYRHYNCYFFFESNFLSIPDDTSNDWSLYPSDIYPVFESSIPNIAHLLHAIIQCICSSMIAYQTLNPMSQTKNIMTRMHIGEQKDLKAYSARTKIWSTNIEPLLKNRRYTVV